MGGNAARGMVLVGLAVLIGIFVLNSGFDSVDLGAEGTVTATDGTANTTDPEPTTDDGSADDSSADTTDGTATGDAAADSVDREPAPPIDNSGFDLRPPEDVRVLVANGTETGGAAGRAKATLVANAYNGLTPQNATLGTDSTVFYYVEGYEGDAREIARLLGGTPDQVQPMSDTPPVADLANAHVFVHLGTDLATSI